MLEVWTSHENSQNFRSKGQLLPLPIVWPNVAVYGLKQWNTDYGFMNENVWIENWSLAYVGDMDQPYKYPKFQVFWGPMASTITPNYVAYYS